jgi:hypothetical protein
MLDFEKQYKIGQPIFEELFKLSSKEIIEKIKSICGSRISNEHFFDTIPTVEKKSVDDRPTDIKLHSYDGIEISAFGIRWCPEHGESIKLLEFNEHFKL